MYIRLFLTGTRPKPQAFYRSGEAAGSIATNALPCVASISGWSDGPVLSRPCEGPLPTQTVTQACSSTPSSTLCGFAPTSSASQQRLAGTWLSLGASPISACSVQLPPCFSPFRSFVVSAAASELCTGMNRGLESSSEVVEAEEVARMVSWSIAAYLAALYLLGSAAYLAVLYT